MLSNRRAIDGLAENIRIDPININRRMAVKFHLSTVHHHLPTRLLSVLENIITTCLFR
tara:strand:- start:656 stop:829 length:174 start_codon:yes stop_codon:yes gene_type:complete